MFLGILESSSHKLHIAHGLTLMTPSRVGGTHNMIIWAFSPTTSQVLGVTPGLLEEECIQLWELNDVE